MFVCLFVCLFLFLLLFLLQMPDTIPAQMHTTQQLLVCLEGKVLLLHLLTFKILDVAYHTLLKMGCFRTAVWGVCMSTPLLLLIECSLSHHLRV